MEKYIKENRIVVCKVLWLEKERAGQWEDKYGYINKEKEAIKKLAIAIENFYIPIKPDMYRETSEYREYLSNQLDNLEKEEQKIKMQGQ